MAAAGDKLTGVGVTFYRSALINSKTEANLETAIVDGNLIDDLATLTPATQTRGTYSKTVMGDDKNIPIAGRLDLGEIGFSVYFDASNSGHTALHADDKETEMTYIIVTETGTEAKTYYAFDAFVTVANLTTPVDEQVLLEVTAMLTTEVTTVDNA